MDIFDRLGNLIRSMLQDDTDDRYRESPDYRDPDMEQAWEELSDYMNEDRPTNSASFDPVEKRRTPDSLRTDYRNLEVEFGAPMDSVRQAYKRLMATYHPDRHSSDPERLQTATEIAKKLNQSFQRIRNHYAEES